jgi:hypothetical protein
MVDAVGDHDEREDVRRSLKSSDAAGDERRHGGQCDHDRGEQRQPPAKHEMRQGNACGGPQREEHRVPGVDEAGHGFFPTMGRESQANVEPRRRLRASGLQHGITAGVVAHRAPHDTC